MRELMLIIHFIGLVMAIGAGFANLFLGVVAYKLEPAERATFMARIRILGHMGQMGLGLLLLSGFGLATPYWKTLGAMPFFIAKLCLIGLLLISVVFVLSLVRKATKEGNPALFARIRPFSMLNFFLGISIIILAVLAFH